MVLLLYQEEVLLTDLVVLKLVVVSVYSFINFRRIFFTTEEELVGLILNEFFHRTTTRLPTFRFL